MDKKSKTAINYRYLAGILTLLLALGAVMQINIPADRQKVPGYYIGNMIVTIDSMENLIYSGNSDQLHHVTTALSNCRCFKQSEIWRQHYRNLEKQP